MEMHRERFGVEPICETLDVSASAYYQRASGQRSSRRIEDERLLGRVREVHQANYECYGYRRVHAQLVREGEGAGRDRVARLMRSEGIRGAKRRGKPWRTTTPDRAAQKRPDLVCRDFSASAPDRLWVGDFTYLRSWEGKLYFAFIIDVFSRMIVGLAAGLPYANGSCARRAADGACRPDARRGLHARGPYRPGVATRTQPVLATVPVDVTVPLASDGPWFGCGWGLDWGLTRARRRVGAGGRTDRRVTARSAATVTVAGVAAVVREHDLLVPRSLTLSLFESFCSILAPVVGRLWECGQPAGRFEVSSAGRGLSKSCGQPAEQVEVR